jgi:hypothetical protein
MFTFKEGAFIKEGDRAILNFGYMDYSIGCVVCKLLGNGMIEVFCDYGMKYLCFPEMLQRA